MIKRLHSGWVRRPFTTVALVCALALACTALVAASTTAARLANFSARVATFTQGRPVATGTDKVMHFRYRGRTRFVRIAVDAEELAIAKELDTSAVFSTVGPVRETYIRRIVDTQSRSRTVGAIAAELGRIRSELELDSDEYLELIADFVQDIPYGVVDNEVRLPVEVVARGSGVCDDKSVLLAALLVHEGYDTVIWAFDSQAHAAVGVRCLGPGMRGSGYAFVETTGPAYVGQLGGTLGSYAKWRRSPQMVHVGGTKRYTADLESAFVAAALQRAKWSARVLEPYLRRADKAPPAWRNAYRAAADRQVEAAQLALMLERTEGDRGELYAMLTSSGGR